MARDRWIIGFLLAVLAALAVAFGVRAVLMGWDGLSRDLGVVSRLYSGDGVANWAMFGHMVSGGLVTAGIGVQLFLTGRDKLRGLHRPLGWLVCLALSGTSLAGLVYILRLGTIGGGMMSLFFSIYGGLILLGVANVITYARAGQWRAHRNWALRLSCLTLAGVFYRLHYWGWEAIAGALGQTEAFTGWFDQLQLLAALPYVAALELWIWRDSRSTRPGKEIGNHHGHYV